MSIFRTEEKNNLKTYGLKPEKIKPYSSMEEIIKEVEDIRLLEKDAEKDKIIDMIYKLLILFQGYYNETYSDDYDPTYGYKVKIDSKRISSDAWDAIEDIVEQLKDDFTEIELFKRAKKSRKDMYIGNFLFGHSIGLMISLFHERTSFESEYELANNCTYESLEMSTIDKIEESAKQYLKAKPFIQN